MQTRDVRGQKMSKNANVIFEMPLRLGLGLVRLSWVRLGLVRLEFG